MPWHGEFVTLALRLPPGLLEAVGYDGDARYVALWLCGDDVVVGDGTSWRTGRWHAFEVFWGHPLGRALLGPYELEPPDHDPYLPATHRLLADRWAQTLAVGETADVEAFLTTQPNPLVALTDGLAHEEVPGSRIYETSSARHALRS